jgi:Fic family protein
MRSFDPGFIERQPLSQGLLQTIRQLGEFKGRQQLYVEQSPQVLKALQHAAEIESTESSNRIEGVVAPHERIAEIVARRSKPRNRPEQEIAGYRDVLQDIHVKAPRTPFTTALVLQMHEDLYRFSTGRGGEWKHADNEITEAMPDGSRRLRFKPLPARETPLAMEDLHARFLEARSTGAIEPLLLIPAYVLDFLCIHPFLDGNGRTARLLTLLLLYQAGYEVGRFISLEQMVERTKRSYYDTLLASSLGWHEGRHDLVPWWEYFLGVMMLGCYREFEKRVGTITVRQGAKREMIVDTVLRLPAEFKVGEVKRACPGISQATINRTLAQMRRDGTIRCVRGGRDAVWAKATVRASAAG